MAINAPALIYTSWRTRRTRLKVRVTRSVWSWLTNLKEGTNQVTLLDLNKVYWYQGVNLLCRKFTPIYIFKSILLWCPGVVFFLYVLQEYSHWDSQLGYVFEEILVSKFNNVYTCCNRDWSRLGSFKGVSYEVNQGDKRVNYPLMV